MSSSSYDFIMDLEPFRGIPEDQMIDVLRMLRPVSFQPGELIFREGDEGRGAFVIQSGAVEIFVQAQPDAVVVAKLQAGEIFGELSLIDGAPRSAGARAMAHSEILCLDKQEFDFLRSQYRPVAFHILRRFSTELCGRIRDTNEQIEQLITSGQVVQRGSPIVTSARRAPVQGEASRGINKWFSVFKRD